MRKVLKSYMISFVKSWVETIGTILFLLMQCAIVLGMLTTPLQINSKVTSVKGDSSNPNYYMKANAFNLTSDFIYNYFLNDKGKSELTYNFNGKVQYDVTDEFDYSKVFWMTNNSDDENNDKESKAFYQKNGLPENFDYQNINESNLQDPDSEIFFRLIQKDINKTIYLDKDEVKTDEDGHKSVFDDEFLDHIYELKESEKQDYIIHLMKPALDKIGKYESNYNWNYSFSYEIGTSPDVVTYDVAPIPTNKDDLSQIKLLKGRMPTSSADSNPIEVLVSSAFYKAANISLNQNIKKMGKYNLKVVGVGYSYDTISNGPGFSIFNGADTDSYGYVYASHDDINKLYQDVHSANNVKNLNIIIRIKTKDNIANYFVADNENNIGMLLGSGQSWETSSSYAPVSALENIRIQVIIYIVLGVIILTLAFVFLNFILKKELNQSRVQIGIFKAMGYTKRQLAWIFALKTLITIAVGVILGYICSIPMQIYAAGQFESSVAVSFDSVYASPVFLIILMIGIPAIFMLISYLLTLRDLGESALDLMKNAVRTNRPNYFLIAFSILIPICGIIWLINKAITARASKSGKHFTWRMQYSFTSSGRGKFVMVISLIAFSAFMFMTLISASSVMNSLISQGFSSVNPNADYRLIWDKKNDLVVKKEGQENKLVFDDRYANENWKPSDLKYIDYSEKGLEETAKQYLDMTAADQISDLFAKAVDYFDHVENKSEKAEIIELTPSMKALFAMMFTDYTNPDGYQSSFDTINTIDLSNPTGALKLARILNNSIKKPTWFWLSSSEKGNAAFRAKDFAKLACEMTSLLMPSDNKFSCNNIGDWQKSLQQSSGSSSDDSNGSAGEMQSGLFGSLLGIASMFDTSSSYNPLITTNTFLYDKTKDFLFYSIAGSKDDSQNIGTPYFRLVNMRQDGLYGKISNGFNLDENASSKLNTLDDNAASTTKNSEQNPINAIVSYRFAKGINAEVGDVVRIYIGNTIKIPVYLKITAIDHNDTFMTNITADVDTFMNQVMAKDYNSQSQLDLLGDEKLIFNSVVSQNTAMLANIDLQNIAESMKTIKIESPVLNVALGKNNGAATSLGASIMSPLLSAMFGDNASSLGDFAKEMTAKTDANVQLLNNISMSGISSSMSNINSIAEFTPFKITLALVNQISSVATMIMSIFIVLDAVMLLIILVVIMNIVVDESSRIILTMRAIGYKNRQINWMVMGNYIIWAIVGFILSYIFIIILWEIISNVVWSHFSILVGIPMTPEIPLIALAVVTAIMLAGWLAAMHKINTSKLTNITD